jgi:hypothetical protein
VDEDDLTPLTVKECVNISLAEFTACTDGKDMEYGDRAYVCGCTRSVRGVRSFTIHRYCTRRPGHQGDHMSGIDILDFLMWGDETIYVSPDLR